MSTGASTRGKALLLDGGFSNELSNYCKTYDVHKEPLWTARALIRDHDAIVQTHLAYLRAGAHIIETSTFQASVPGFQEFHGINAEEAEALMTKSVKLAHVAVETFTQNTPKDATRTARPLVAGSIGPYGAYLRDGSEYTGSYMENMKTEKLIEFHLPRVRALINGGADFLLVETIPSLDEAVAVLSLIQQKFPNTDVWICFSVKATHSSMTPCGEPFTLVLDTIKKFPQVKALGINCCSPKDVLPFLQSMNAVRNSLPELSYLKLVVYPNSGDDWIRGTGWIVSDTPRIYSYTRKWLEEGADVIGGCCQVGPEDIAKLRVVLDEWNLPSRVEDTQK